jgi:creatinine amidohydrolase
MPLSVRYEEMLPHEFQEAMEAFPVAYAPFGSLEWHGLHLALGNDALKAHGILVRTAEKYGGVVVPPTYWGHMDHWRPGCHPGVRPEVVDELFADIFRGLVRVGFKVVIGVTGHDVREQVASLRKAVEAISGGAAAGFAMMEADLNPDDPEVGMDHAGHWETSYLMSIRPELVDLRKLAAVATPQEKMDWEKVGIGGRNPLKYASRARGERAINKMVDAIGAKAQELLAEAAGHRA